MKTRRILLLALLALSAFAVAGSTLAPRSRSYGSATLERFIQTEGQFIFRCDIKDFPPIVGEDIPVRISSIAPPETVSRNHEPNLFYQQQLEKFITEALKKAEKIELKNIRRGSKFNLVADVYVDDQNLAFSLIKHGLACRQISPIDNPAGNANKTQKPPKAAKGKSPETSAATAPQTDAAFVASKTSKIFHRPTCRSAKRITDENKVTFKTRQQAIDSDRRPCKSCKP